MTHLRDLSKETADILEEFDGMKTVSATDSYKNLPNLSTEAYKFYMREIYVTANENDKEIERMIKMLQDRFRKL